MCDVCGCGDESRVSLDVHHSLLSSNDKQAAHLREHFREDGVTVINLMGSPGSGKTALLEATARALGEHRRLTAVSGDLATTHDADRLARTGIVAETITTGTACHLEARMIHDVLHGHRLRDAVHASDFFFIENVGNLVCPAIYDLGQTANVVALSLTEGVDKPLKYPVMFKNVELVVLTKLDLLPYLPGVSLEAVRDSISRVTPTAAVLSVSALTGEGIPAWAEWLESQRTDVSLAKAAAATRPHDHATFR